MTASEALAYAIELLQPKPEHDPATWDALLADVDEGRSHE